MVKKLTSYTLFKIWVRQILKLLYIIVIPWGKHYRWIKNFINFNDSFQSKILKLTYVFFLITQKISNNTQIYSTWWNYCWIIKKILSTSNTSNTHSVQGSKEKKTIWRAHFSTFNHKNNVDEKQLSRKTKNNRKT